MTVRRVELELVSLLSKLCSGLPGVGAFLQLHCGYHPDELAQSPALRRGDSVLRAVPDAENKTIALLSRL